MNRQSERSLQRNQAKTAWQQSNTETHSTDNDAIKPGLCFLNALQCYYLLNC